jgi:hypothetical protein
MIISGAPSARGAPRSAHAQSASQCTAIVLAALSLVAAFVLAGAPTAMATTAAAEFTNAHVTSLSDLRSRPCRGKKPGVCPNSADMRSPDARNPGRQSDGSGHVSDRSGGDAKRNESAH